MAIIRYPDSREDLFGMIIRVLVHLKFLANSLTSKVLFIFDITVLVHHRYQFIHSDWLYIL